MVAKNIQFCNNSKGALIHHFSNGSAWQVSQSDNTLQLAKRGDPPLNPLHQIQNLGGLGGVTPPSKLYLGVREYPNTNLARARFYNQSFALM